MKSESSFGRIKLPQGKTANDLAKEQADFRLRQEDITDVLDGALTAAENVLKSLLPDTKPENVTALFHRHVGTHLRTELENIKSHGHRGDDPEFSPDTVS